MTVNTITHRTLVTQAASTSAWTKLRSAWADAVELLALWQARSRYRTELMYLSPRQVDDMGLDPLAIEIEVRKPFWRA